MQKDPVPAISARLALEDGSIFTGRAFGATISGDDGQPTTSVGEVVFNTAMCGYQEALTDPSYAGQILTMTAPEIGNYGINLEDVESTKVQVAGFIVRELSRIVSNYRATTDVASWLAEHGILGLTGIDTRALTRRLRVKGSMKGVISADSTLTDEHLIQLARRSPEMAGQNLVTGVSTPTRLEWDATLGEWRNMHHRQERTPNGNRPRHVVAIDCGAKENILRHLADRGCRVTVVPYDISAGAARDLKPDGLFISNGPGDPAAVERTIALLRDVAGEVPTFGICLGHQLLCLALGAKTYKLKFGHRGTNQPVKNLLTGRVEITSQNHGFAVDTDSILKEDCEPTHINLNDKTLAGFRHRTKPIFAVQYHPEASPGPHDANYLFDCFMIMIDSRQPLTAEQMLRAEGAVTQPV